MAGPSGRGHRGDRVRADLEAALLADHAPRDVAGSFAVGVFITTLPTLGAGLLAFVAIAALFDRVNKLALFASVLVLNPVVKWGVYGASFWLGTHLLGPVPDVSTSTVSLSTGPDILSRLLVGNVLLATAFTVAAYAGALRLVRDARRRTADADDVPSAPLGE